LLSRLAVPFEVVPSAVDERLEGSFHPADYVKRLAMRKAGAVAERFPDDFVIGADTIVVLDSQILGKPGNRDEARNMLTRLSGKTHSVYTGVSIWHQGDHTCFFEKTDVTFWNLTPDEIERYIQSGEPYDKAGAYGIQGFASIFVKRMEGDYFTVVGLPIGRLYRELVRMGYPFFPAP
jgi:MAF protein